MKDKNADAEDDVNADADAEEIQMKKMKKQMRIEIRSGSEDGPSLSPGKEALSDRAVDKARATISCRRSSIAMKVAGVLRNWGCELDAALWI